MEPIVSLMEGLVELLGIYRYLHIPKLPKTFTQDLFSPYFARRRPTPKARIVSRWLIYSHLVSGLRGRQTEQIPRQTMNDDLPLGVQRLDAALVLGAPR